MDVHVLVAAGAVARIANAGLLVRAGTRKSVGRGTSNLFCDQCVDSRPFAPAQNSNSELGHEGLDLCHQYNFGGNFTGIHSSGPCPDIRTATAFEENLLCRRGSFACGKSDRRLSMNRLRAWIAALWSRIRFLCARPLSTISALQFQRQRQQQRRQTRQPAPNDLAQLYENIFSDRESADEHVHFQQISSTGVFVEKSETWFRDGDALRSVVTRGKIVSCSGRVAGPEAIQAVCGVCGGFETALMRCAACAISLCHLDVRQFEHNGLKLSLCPQHFAAAMASRNMWDSLPRIEPRR